MTKILVAHDELDIRGLLVDAPRDVIEAENGSATLLENAYDENPDNILLDVMMPAMDGFQALVRPKNSSATRSIPVIKVATKGQEQDQLKAMNSGARDYITKPWGPDELESKVIGVETAISK